MFRLSTRGLGLSLSLLTSELNCASMRVSAMRMFTVECIKCLILVAPHILQRLLRIWEATCSRSRMGCARLLRAFHESSLSSLMAHRRWGAWIHMPFKKWTLSKVLQTQMSLPSVYRMCTRALFINLRANRNGNVPSLLGVLMSFFKNWGL